MGEERTVASLVGRSWQTVSEVALRDNHLLLTARAGSEAGKVDIDLDRGTVVPMLLPSREHRGESPQLTPDVVPFPFQGTAEASLNSRPWDVVRLREGGVGRFGVRGEELLWVTLPTDGVVRVHTMWQHSLIPTYPVTRANGIVLSGDARYAALAICVDAEGSPLNGEQCKRVLFSLDDGSHLGEAPASQGTADFTVAMGLYLGVQFVETEPPEPIRMADGRCYRPWWLIASDLQNGEERWRREIPGVYAGCPPGPGRSILGVDKATSGYGGPRKRPASSWVPMC